MKRKIRQEHIHFVWNRGGLGDNIARLPAIKYILDNYPWVTPHLIVPTYIKDYIKAVLPNLSVMDFKEDEIITANRQKIGGTKRNIIYSDLDQVTIIRQHLVKHAFNCLLDCDPKFEDFNYVKSPISKVDLTPFNLPSKYFVFTCLFTAEVREFPPKMADKIVKFIQEKGYQVVFLGKDEAKASKIHTIKAETAVDLTQGINLINKTTLLEAAAIMGNSMGVIGLDNGLLHLAATTDAPIIYGFTTVDPDHRLPMRYDQVGWNIKIVIPPKSLDCRFCQSKMNFVYNHDFTKCYYGHRKCVENMSELPYINAIQDLLNDNWENNYYE